MKAAALVMALLATGVAKAQNIVSEAQIHRAVENFVHNQLSSQLGRDERVQVEVRWQGDVVMEGEGAPQIRVRPASSRPLRGPTVMRVGIDVGGQTQRRLSVTGDVRFFRPVLVAGRAIGRGEALPADAVEVAERDVTGLEGNFYTAVGELEELRARRTLSPGEVITRQHLEKVPVVQRGDQVQLVAWTAQMSVSTLGVALQDGGLGERIRVRNSDSGKVLYGQVLDRERIRVGR
jgi:flagella basal body P-ring formation protein FlgA